MPAGTSLLEQSDYTERYNKLTEKHAGLDLLELSFDDVLWNWSVERVTVFVDGMMRFGSRNGLEVKRQTQ